MLLAYGLIVILLGARRGRRPYLWYAAAADDSELCERRVPAAGLIFALFLNTLIQWDNPDEELNRDHFNHSWAECLLGTQIPDLTAV